MKTTSKFFSFVGILSLTLLTAGCGKVTGTFGGKKKTAISVMEKTTGAEIVSSSQQAVVTLGGYKVYSSAGNTLDKLETTTSGGYKVQMTVQGMLTSE